ncbi:DUF2894 domain-containing protein, partial [Oxalobacteraceae bacterium OM1]
MTETASVPAMDAPAAGQDAVARLAALRAAGARQFDPARWHYLEALAARVQAYAGSAGRLLEAKLTHALAAF